jgi:hypothetical protein
MVDKNTPKLAPNFSQGFSSKFHSSAKLFIGMRKKARIIHKARNWREYDSIMVSFPAGVYGSRFKD